jgi:hypothetical protein
MRKIILFGFLTHPGHFTMEQRVEIYMQENKF